MPVFQLSEELAFPSPFYARKDGLLAVGGDLSVKRLLLAYRMGIFPWSSDDQPILWWSPDPRMVLYPCELKISKSLQKIIRKKEFTVTMDSDFESVIRMCAEVRRNEGHGTWITEDMIASYCALHEEGFAHSVEAWHGDKMVGGLYGVSLGRAFFGESMFTHENNASKVAFVALTVYINSLGFDLIDCQIRTAHLARFGAVEIPRSLFLALLKKSLKKQTLRGKWTVDITEQLFKNQQA